MECDDVEEVLNKQKLISIEKLRCLRLNQLARRTFSRGAKVGVVLSLAVSDIIITVYLIYNINKIVCHLIYNILLLYIFFRSATSFI